MKLRLDRVMKLDLWSMSDAEVLSAGEELPEFKKPEKWTAPLPPSPAPPSPLPYGCGTPQANPRLNGVGRVVLGPSC